MKTLVLGLKRTISGIPAGMSRFLLRGVLLFVGWRLLYELVLRPSGIPDTQLTESLVWATYHLLLPFYDHVTINGYSIYIRNEPAVTIATGCNGLELIVLYVGFLLCYRTHLKRLLLFIFWGVALIMVMNLLRCAALAVLYYRHFPLWDFMHHYVFKLIIYGVNFYLWVLYCRTDAVPKT